MANHYVKYFFADPKRGYGPSIRVVLAKLKMGADYKTSGTLMYPGMLFNYHKFVRGLIRQWQCHANSTGGSSVCQL